MVATFLLLKFSFVMVRRLNSLAYMFVILWGLGCKDKNSHKISLINQSDSIRLQIKGKWGDQNGRAIYEIREDSIFYFARDSSFPYKLFGDTLYVKVPEIDTPVAWGKMSVSKDTLFIKDIYVPNQTTFGFRCK